MCGFAGVIAWDDRFRVTRDALEKMSATIAHRGPDGSGLWFSHEGTASAAKPQAALAHRRLAIIDPDPRANQPFTDHRGRWLVYNGEIYNFRALRKELESLRPDYQWRTQCDTEVLLVAYDAWGERCVEHFEGMFAFAIWDEPAGLVYLARDRMGQKPLYVALVAGADAGRIAACGFASEIGALRHMKGADLAVDSNSISQYLRWGYIAAPATIYRGVEKLPPGHWMLVRPRGIEIQDYFDPNAPKAIELLPSTEPAQRARTLISEAVQRQLVSDVPLGCFLSGGVDSSVIAAAMKSAVGRGQDVLTFCIGFDDPRYDERQHAADVAKHLGTKHHEFLVRPNAADDLPKLAAVFGEPFADSSALPTHYLSRETRKHVKVALSGDGGDELFGGYDRYRAMWMGESFARMPKPLRSIAMSKLWHLVPASSHPKSHMSRAKRLLASLELPPARRYASYMRLFDEMTIGSLLRNFERPADEKDDDGQGLTKLFEALSLGRDPVRAAMALDRITYLPEDLLTKVDRASMLHALEIRSPFMDHELVHFAAGLGTSDLFGKPPGAASFMKSPMASRGKRILREAFAPDLPDFVFKRRKSGFAVPIGDWFRGELRPLLRESVLSSDSFAGEHFMTGVIEKMIDEHERQRADHSQRLYALLMLELWWRSARASR